MEASSNGENGYTNAPEDEIPEIELIIRVSFCFFFYFYLLNCLFFLTIFFFPVKLFRSKWQFQIRSLSFRSIFFLFLIAKKGKNASFLFVCLKIRFTFYPSLRSFTCLYSLLLKSDKQFFRTISFASLFSWSFVFVSFLLLFVYFVPFFLWWCYAHSTDDQTCFLEYFVKCFLRLHRFLLLSFSLNPN